MSSMITSKQLPGVAFKISVVVSHKNNKPCIELRRNTTEIELIKAIVSCAFHGRPITIIPTVNDKLRSVCSLVEQGIIYKGEDEQFYFTL